MDPSKKYKVMMTLNLSDISSISLSPDDGNQLVLVHLQGSNDMVLAMKSKKNEDLTGEDKQRSRGKGVVNHSEDMERGVPCESKKMSHFSEEHDTATS